MLRQSVVRLVSLLSNWMSLSSHEKAASCLGYVPNLCNGHSPESDVSRDAKRVNIERDWGGGELPVIRHVGHCLNARSSWHPGSAFCWHSGESISCRELKSA